MKVSSFASGGRGPRTVRVPFSALRWLTALRWALCLPFICLAPAVADASPSYGYFLIQYYQFRPGCTGCHTSATGGEGTVMQPFGLTMVSLGLTGGEDVQLLVDTLNALGQADSDGDGAIDAEEIMGQGDPNDPAVQPEGFVGSEATAPAPMGSTSTDASDMVPAGGASAGLASSDPAPTAPPPTSEPMPGGMPAGAGTVAPPSTSSMPGASAPSPSSGCSLGRTGRPSGKWLLVGMLAVTGISRMRRSDSRTRRRRVGPRG